MKRELIEIIVHKITPCIKGFTPTFFKTSLDRPAPIKNNVNVKPIVEILTNSGERSSTGLK